MGSEPVGASGSLRAIAQKLIWWQPPAVSLEQPRRFLAQIMALGNWEEVQVARRTFGDEAFRVVLRDAPPGVFDMRSWTYWHHVFGLLPVPMLPRRRLGE